MKGAGRISDSLVQMVDIFPTLTQLCDLPAPDELDGKSLTPFLADAEHQWARPALSFWSGGSRTIRTSRWRLIVHPARFGKQAAPESWELFDMQADPHESTNVAGLHPEVVARLLDQHP